MKIITLCGLLFVTLPIISMDKTGDSLAKLRKDEQILKDIASQNNQELIQAVRDRDCESCCWSCMFLLLYPLGKIHSQPSNNRLRNYLGQE